MFWAVSGLKKQRERQPRHPRTAFATFDTNQLRAGLESFRTSIAERLSETLPLTFEQAFAGVDYGKKGEDFMVALPRFRVPGKVAEIAATIIEGFQPDEWIESIIFDRSFLRFRVNTTNMICKVLNQLKYSSNNSGKGKKVIIEYSSPNIIKEFHLGHLQSTVIGAFLANLYKACGWEVILMNYLGDWGTQFSLVATGYEKYGSQEEYNNDPLMHLYNVYIKVTRDVEADPKVKHGWRETSLKKYQEAYNWLNIKFEVYTGESNVNKESMEKALGQLEHMGLISDREGAREVDLKKWNLMAPIVRKLDGTSTYIICDIGGAIERYEQYKFDKMIYVVGSAQDFHLTQFFKVLELMGFPWAKNLLHIHYRMVQGMSTRKGTAVFLDRIIKKAGDMMHEQMKKNEDKYAAVEDLETMSLEIAITGIKIQDMAAKQINDYTFNWDRMLSFKGDTGAYLQYAHAQLASIGRKNPHLLPLPPASQIAMHTLAQYPRTCEITFLLGTYPDVVEVALKTHEPRGLVHVILTGWDSVIVKGEEDVQKARAKMYLYDCAREVLAAAMRLLSVRPLERM
ncbi:hypothetical protein B0H10DRAFT_2172137 [Mycena sp. CBHHK59/15]|nr:hypothetical protein B0H10DRAFT_2172137 [Mycena sp. CBHHK59/15]